ncbi:MAG TPA: hypothetical protein VOA64_05560 [Candidatus Dormibacteraeota bacterium]|nr:hypothetical protein [Candidatus Dormibacteraeota bacterium]
MSTERVNEKREFLRHTVATAAYRGGKALRNAPDSFGDFGMGDTPRTPAKILAHVGDLFEWAYSMARGETRWHDSEPLPWDAEVNRFFAAIKRFDDYLGSNEPLRASVEALFQGPVADALTHIGQIAMLRRVAGCPIRGENYSTAEVATGRVGFDQATARHEFD